LCRPTDRKLHPASGNQELVGRKQDTIAAHVYGFARAGLVAGLPIQDAIANFALQRKTVRSPPVVLIFRGVQSFFLWMPLH
jgi:hypothetical protein